MLVTGYKFHLRIYMLVTSTTPEVRAYVHNDGHAMFCTKEFTMDANTLGKHFDGTVHLSNYDINCAKTWTSTSTRRATSAPAAADLVALRLDRGEPRRRPRRRDVAADPPHLPPPANYIAAYPTVTKWHEVDDAGGDARAHRSELFGVDMMLDAAGGVAPRGDNSPGLEYCDSTRRASAPTPAGTTTSQQICHGRFALLGMDRDVCAKGDANNFVRVC